MFRAQVDLEDALVLPRERTRERLEIVVEHEGYRSKDDDSRRIVDQYSQQTEHAVEVLLLRTFRFRYFIRRTFETVVARGEHISVLAIVVDPRRRGQGSLDKERLQYRWFSIALYHADRGRGEDISEISGGRGVLGSTAPQDDLELSGEAQTIFVR